MDAKALYPKGFHPVYPHNLPDLSDDAPTLPRALFAVKYYFVDFGISSYIPPDSQEQHVLGDFGRDQDVPELSTTVPYDPFKVDVFILGNLFEKVFIEVRPIQRNAYTMTHSLQTYSNVGFLRSLAQSMKTKDPKSRPTAQQSYDQWLKLRKRITSLQRSWRLRTRDESWRATLTQDIAFVPQWIRGLRRRRPTPTASEVAK